VQLSFAAKKQNVRTMKKNPKADIIGLQNGSDKFPSLPANDGMPYDWGTKKSS